MTDWILRNVANGADKGVVVVCGNGNNGGDGLVIARRLKMCGLRVDVLMVDKDGRMSPDCEVNLIRYEEKFSKVLCAVDFNDYDIIVDAMFGSGLNRPLGGLYADMADRINASGKLVVAVDIPSGLYGDDNSNNPFEHIVKAHHTLTLQFPKLAFMMPESEAYTGEVQKPPPRTLRSITTNILKTCVCCAGTASWSLRLRCTICVDSCSLGSSCLT